jgi:hypothetical protein
MAAANCKPAGGYMVSGDVLDGIVSANELRHSTCTLIALLIGHLHSGWLLHLFGQDYFNYGFNERTWREYCKKVEQFRWGGMGGSARLAHELGLGVMEPSLSGGPVV